MKSPNPASWSDIKRSGSGKIVANWYPSSLFITQKGDDLEGFEYELFKSFIAFTEKKYNVSVDVEWRLADDFTDLLNKVSSSKKGHFGISSISITPRRRELMDFTPTHFPDLMVLVSNSDFPTAKTTQDFIELFKESVIVTIRNTTMERQLLELNTNLKLKGQFQYVDNTGQLITKIESVPNSFGYIDLANFMTALNESAYVKRQYFYPIRLEGLSFVHPMGSDWSEPINAYYSSQQFEIDRENLIQKYLGDNVQDLIERISKSAELGPYDEIILLTEEKELQAKELLAAALREQSRQRMINWLSVGVFLVILLALFFYVRFQIKVRANQALESNQQLTERHNSQLLALNQEKNDLIRVLAHDLRNPINQLIGFSELLLEDIENLNEDQITMLRFMNQSSGKLSEMITKILDVDAIEAGDRNVILEKILAESIILKVFDSFSNSAQAKDIQLKRHFESNIYVLADKVYLVQTLENLVSNAIKFSKANTEILISMYSTENEVVFSVKDEGPGFSKNEQEKIFMKYQQFSAKSTAGESSTGLGLSIVKMFVEMMDGSVTYETEEGVGTVFYVQLPRVS